jgi:hypothetical protein
MKSHMHPCFTPTDLQTSGQAPGLKVKTHIKAGSDPIGSTGTNHNETLVRIPRPAVGLTVKTHGNAGGSLNHNQPLARPPSLKVKTHVKAGITMPKLDGSSKDAA